MDALAEFGRMVVATLLGSGVATSLLDARAARRLKRADDVRTDVDRALDALAALRDAYVGAVAAGIDARTVQRLEVALELATARTTSAAARAAGEYIAAGQGYAYGALDAGAERAAYSALVASLISERRRPG